jgi:hypothetical protein
MRKLANFDGGWCAHIQSNPSIWVIVKKGRSSGRRYGRWTFEWRGHVIVNGKFVWSGQVTKGVTVKALCEKIPTQFLNRK